ncbi:Gluconate 2-dehydrogenase cytochrome c subunit [Burkholderiales bacterium 8X]|nr:Gluconate 2-dehydrogenase cytochrome c subunit [Burkholderiales bacterium 8X]
MERRVSSAAPRLLAASVLAMVLAVQGCDGHRDGSSNTGTASADAASPGAAATPTLATGAPRALASADRGEYLSRAANCIGCHTPAGGAPFSGGLAVNSPFGKIYSTNITPDPWFGIGRYSYDDFARVLREGRVPGGRHLYPAMPYTAYTHLQEEDVRSLYDFLMQRVAPVRTPSPPTRLPFPFNQRWVLGAWQAMFLDRGPQPARADRSAEWNRGAYLVQAVGHCGACHTPRGPAYQEKGGDPSSPHFLTGEVNDRWYAPNLTGAMGDGLGRWKAEEIASFLKTGHGAREIAYGSMAGTVVDSLQHLREDDLRAMAVYLKALPARKSSASYAPEGVPARSPAKGDLTVDSESVGAVVYRSFCVQCHQPDGGGVPELFPRLAGSSSVLGAKPDSLIRLVLEGGDSAETLTGPPRRHMPGFAAQLTDPEVAQVLTHVRSSWGNDARPVTGSQVAKVRRQSGK